MSKWVVEFLEDDPETLYLSIYEHRKEGSAGARLDLVTSARFFALSDATFWVGHELSSLMGEHWY